MSVANTEKRVHPRSEFFFLNAGGQQATIYAFRPENAGDAIPAIVVDLSEGGIQILSVTHPPEHCQLELAVGEKIGTGQKDALRLIWSRPDGMNIRSGYAFKANATSLERVKKSMVESEHHIVRCVLYPDA